MLFRGDANKDLTECTVCKHPRFKPRKDLEDDGSEDDTETEPEKNNNKNKKNKKNKQKKKKTKNKKRNIPWKVCWYLPIGPRVKRLFSNPDTAQLMRWHAEKRVQDGMLRHPADSPQWRVIDRLRPLEGGDPFGKDPRNIRFALSTDGMNPFGNMSTTRSTWPVNLSIYNLPPWLCMKRRHIMLAILIEGPKQPGNDIDVYLEPLVEDLERFWIQGLQIYDAFAKESFTLRCMLFITINDYPALGNSSGQTIRGPHGCVKCIKKTASKYLHHCRKTVYMRHRRFLSVKHHFRYMKEMFDNTIETDLAPPSLSGKDIYAMVEHLKVVFGKGKREKEKSTVKLKRKVNRKDGEQISTEEPPKEKKETPIWKKKSIYWRLPYWKHLFVRHSIDVMHIEKNVLDSIIGTLLNMKDKTKDSANARLEYRFIRGEVVEPLAKGAPKPKLGPVDYVLEKKEAKEVCESLYGVKFPVGCAANMKNIVSLTDSKLTGMKSHDCHVMMTQTLPVAIRGVLKVHVRTALTKLCEFFSKIYQKVIDPKELDGIQTDVVQTLCELETIFPLSFFDIMVHLIVHIVEEIRMCGPVFIRSMYPFERFMGILKHYVRNRSRPEGSIIEGYATEEVIEFCLEYMKRLEPIGVPRSIHAGKLCGVGTTGKITITPDRGDYALAHFHVLQHFDVVTPYIDAHKQQLQEEHPLRKSIVSLHNSQFNEWFKEKLRGVRTDDVELSCLSKGPTWQVRQFQGYKINGYTFGTKAKDAVTTTQNSGVSLYAQEANGESRMYYGYIEEMWELDYVEFQITVFRCRWVEKSQVRPNDGGCTTVNLDRLSKDNEPFVVAHQVHQVFYMVDPKNKNRHVVLQSKRNIMGVDGVISEEEYNKTIGAPGPSCSFTSGDDDEEEGEGEDDDEEEGEGEDDDEEEGEGP